MADAAETVKKTVESTAKTAKAQSEAFQAAGAQAFKDGLEKSTAAFSELGVQSKQNLDAVVASATAAQKGAEALSSQALSYGKTSWETGVSAAQTIAKARSVQELIELQTAYTKSAMETYLAEMTKMSETFAASVKDSFKPLNERVTASVEKFQAAR
jgi:phasin family protein